jgi:hypothetical protein
MLVSLPGLFFNHEDGSDMLLQIIGWLSSRLHGVVSQKIENFITSTARTSNPSSVGL